jgi:hypothetical protein
MGNKKTTCLGRMVSTTQTINQRGGYSYDAKLVVIDSTALRSILYDQQAGWGKSTRYKWYRDYKLHLATTSVGIILPHELTTGNVYDSKVAPHLLNQLTEFEIEFVLGDKAYDSRLIHEQA